MNHRFVFFGQIHPSSSSLTFPRPLVWTATNGRDESPLYSVTATILQGCLTAVVDWNQREPSWHELLSFRNGVREQLAGFVDSFGLASGNGMDVELSTVVLPDKSTRQFNALIDELGSPTESASSETFSWLAVTVGRPELRRALADFRLAIKDPWSTGFHCFRSIECLKQNFRRDGDQDDRPSWRRMGEALCVEQSYVERLRETWAFKQRHGQFPKMSHSERVDALERTREIIRRYREHVGRGATEPLNEEEFPTLTEEART